MKSDRERKNYKKRVAQSSHAGMASGVAKYRHSYRLSKRIIAFVLAFAMVLGLVYVDGKRKKAKADGDETYSAVAFNNETYSVIGDDIPESVTDNNFITNYYNLGGKDASSIASEDFSVDTIAVPYNSIKLALPQINPVISEDSAYYVEWINGYFSDAYSSLINENFAPGGEEPLINDAKSTNIVKYMENGANNKVQLVKFSFVKNEEVWELSGSEKVTELNYQTSSIDGNALKLNQGSVSKNYVISSPDDGNYADYYTGYYVSKDATSIATIDEIKGAELVSEEDALAIINNKDNSADGTYGIYKVTKFPDDTESETAKPIFKYSGGVFIRDNVINASEDGIKLYVGGNEYKNGSEMVISPTEDELKVSIEIDEDDLNSDNSDGIIYSIKDEKGVISAAELAPSDNTIGLKSGTPIEVTLPQTDISAKGKTVKLVVELKDNTGKDRIPVTQTFEFTYDNANPVIDEEGITCSDSKGSIAIVDGAFSTNEDSVTISVSANPGGKAVFKDDSCVVKEGTTEIGKYTIGSDNKYIVDISGISDGTHEYTFEVTNSYGNTTNATVTVKVDATAPVINLIEASQEGNSDSISITSGKLDNKVTTMRPVSFKFEVVETGSGVKGNPEIEGCNVVANEDGTFTATYTPDASDKGKEKELEINVSDNAGNPATAAKIILPFLNDELKIENGVIQLDTDGKKADGKDIYNGNVKLVFEISTDSEITDDSTASLIADGNVNLKAKASDYTLSTPSKDGDNYKYTATFTLAESETVKYENIKFNIANKYGVTADTPGEISILTIDLTDPTAEVEIDEANSDIEEGAEWYRNLFIIVKYQDTDNTGIEAGIDKIKISNVETMGGDDSGEYSPTEKGFEIFKVKDSITKDGTEVEIKVYDKVGNESQLIKETYKVDGVKPSSATLSVQSNSVDVDSTKYYDDADIKYEATDNIGISSYILTVTGPDEESSAEKITDGSESEVTGKLSDFAGEFHDGVYKVAFVAKDLAFNEKKAAEYTLNIDTTAPVITEGVVVQEGIDDNTVSMDTGADEFIAPYKLTSTKGYSVRFKVDEANLDTVTINGTAVTEDADGYYTVQFPANPDNKGKDLSYLIVATDKAGHKVSKILKIGFISEEINITIGTPEGIDVNSGIINTNKGNFNVVYTITSDAEIDEGSTSFTAAGTDSDKVTATGDGLGFKKISTEEDDAQYKFKYEYTVNINVPENDSAVIEDLEFTTKSVNGISKDADPITKINIDQIKPIITIHKDDASGEAPSETDWYDSLTVYIEYDEGSDEYVSHIKESDIKITGRLDQSSVVHYLDASGNVIGTTVVMEESETAEGSALSVSVTDGVGNRSSEGPHFYKIDSTAPGAMELKVGPDDIDGMVVTSKFLNSGDPTISYKAYDNIQIKNAILKVTAPGVTEFTTETIGEVTNDTTIPSVDISGVLSEIAKTGADGEYIFELSAVDNVGHSATALKGGFTLDNTKPSLGNVVMSQEDSSLVTETLDITSETGDKIFTGHPTATKGQKLKFVVDLKDNNLDWDKTTITNRKTGNSIKPNASNYDETEGKLTFEEIPDNSWCGETVNYDIVATDKAGNVTKSTYSVKFLSDNVEVTYEVLDYKGNADYTEGVENLTNDDDFLIRFTIKSDAKLELKDSTLTQTTSRTPDSNYNESNFTLMQDKVDDYIYTYDYVVKTDEGKSVVIDNLILGVQSVNGIKAENTPVSVIKVDFNKSNLGIDDTTYANIGADRDGITWYKSLVLIVNADDNESDTTQAYVSGVDTVTVSQNGGANTTIANTDALVTVEQSPDENGTDLVFTVTDKVGNVKEFTANFHVDGVDPTGEFAVKFNGTPAVADQFYSGNPDVTLKISDDIKVYDYTFTITGPNGTSTFTNNDKPIDGIESESGATKKLSEYLNLDGKNLVDGEYEVTFEGYDLANNEYDKKSIKFNIDNTDPEVVEGKVIQAGRDGNSIAMNTEGQDIFEAPIKITAEDAYKVRFTISENNLKNVSIKEDGTDVTYTHTDGTTEYDVEKTSDSGRRGKTVNYEITIEDNAGTVITKMLQVKFLSESIKIERSISDNNVEVDSDGKINTNVGKFDIVYKITSDDELIKEKAKHTATGKDAGEAKSDGLKYIEDESDPANNKYVYTYTVGIDLSENDSALIGKLSLEVENRNGVNQDSDTEGVSIEEINIDQVKPEIAIYKKDTTDEPDDISKGTWYKNLPIEIVYDEGSDEYISHIDESDITIEGVIESSVQHVKDENGNVIKTIAEVDETKAVDAGTTVKVDIQDRVGNNNSEKREYLVDSTDPNKLTLKVDGKNIEEMSADNDYLNTGDPGIKYEAYDNLQIKETVLEVTTPGKTTPDEYKKEGDVTNDTTKPSVLVEDNLSKIAKTAEDGIYKFKLSATDNSENGIGPIEGSFTLDNTKPVISNIKLSQSGVPNFRQVEKNKKWGGASAKHKLVISLDTDDPNDNASKSESGLVSVKVTESVDGSEPTTVIDTNYTNSTKKESNTVTIDSDPSKAGKVVNYRVVAKDRAGNEQSHTFAVSYIEDKITVKHTFADKTETKDGQHVIEFIIDADAPIKENGVNMSVKLTPDDGKTELKGKLSPITEDAKNDKFKYSYKYSIKANDSDRLDNITCVVTNVNGVKSEPDSISYVYIDLRNPEVTLDNTDQVNWSDELRLILSFKDNSREFKSGIKSIKVTGVKQDPTGSGFTVTKDKGSTDSLGGFEVGLDVKESNDINGTPVSIEIIDQVGNKKTVNYVFHVDETPPTSSLNVNGKSYTDIMDTFIGTTSLNPPVEFTVNDNIQIRDYKLDITLPSGDTITVKSGKNANNININSTLGELIGSENCNGDIPKDGKYTLTLSAYDMPGQTPVVNPIVTSFTLDNTVPKNDLQITTARPTKFDKFNNTYSNERTGLTYQYGQYYGQDVSIDAIVVDDNVDNVTVTDNGRSVYSGETGTSGIIISDEGYHEVVISTVDKSGLRAQSQSVGFTIDKTAPVLSVSLNGSPFPEGGATRYLNVNGDISVSYVDENKDTDDLNMIATITPPGSGQRVNTNVIAEGSQNFGEEADYSVRFVAIDRAGNRGEERTVTFRVDKTKPELSFTGASDHGTSRASVTMNYIVNEAFYSDMNSCVVRVYKRVDGSTEALLRTIDVKPNSARYSMSELFEDDGEYRFEMTAEDKCGNQSTASYTFILDGKAPIITLNGVKNYDKTAEDVTMGITVDEVFFSSNKVVLSGTRQDIEGVKHKIDFNSFNVNGSKVSNFEQIFKEDGIYDITVTSTDRAGNSTTKQVHFTIDRTAPVINEIDKYADKVLKTFKWDVDGNKLVTDLTVCEIAVYMDGVEYDGTSDIREGAHVLRVTATDELGHTTEKEVSFILDSGAPNILVSGVEEGQYLKVPTVITVSVELDSDKLTKVTLNGEEIKIVDGVATFTVDTRKAYVLKAEAVDDAGNVTSLEMNFNFGERFPWWILLAGGGALLLIFLIILLSRKREKKEEK